MYYYGYNGMIVLDPENEYERKLLGEFSGKLAEILDVIKVGPPEKFGADTGVGSDNGDEQSDETLIGIESV